MRPLLSFLLRLTISLALVAWLIAQDNPARIAAEARGADVRIILLAFALYLLAIAMNAYKWGVLLRAQRVEVPLRQLLRSTFVGLFFGNFLPSNVGGDAVRAFDLSRSAVNGTAAATSVIVDRLVGLLVFIASAALFGTVAAMWTGATALWHVAVLSLALFAATLLLFLGLITRSVTRQARYLFVLLPPLNRLRMTGRTVADAFAAYRRAPGAIASAAAISFGIQTVTSVVNWLCGVAIGAEAPFVYFFVFNPIIAFVLLVPISINGLGVQQAVYVFFYASLAGVMSEAQALTMSLLMQGVIVGAGLLGGVAWLSALRRPTPAARDASGDDAASDPQRSPSPIRL
ncbi:MAG: lysylphosphatidylglycerol synthase transmembrane domain-containing protein [Chloroflexota bacterium]|nr:flippase-like domain-containing protein [Dehalococcoidia bacterium]MDW8253449.1 lysylphosphatidylglycerol synthase transmembrane domain-containing protein [Chloroflexota bacterium]